MLRRSTLLLLLVPLAAAVSGCSIGTPDPATNVTDTTATLNGSLYSNQEGDVQYWFKYGTTTDYGSQTPEHTLHVAAGRDIQKPLEVSIPVTGLTPETTYHFQLCTAPPRDGCVQRDQTFRTGPAGGASGIAFTSFRQFIHIWRMDPDGANQARMTTNGFSESAPSFSPDARKVAYVSQRAPNSTDIFVANADGTDEQRLTTTGTNSEPVWSPDGRKIAFISSGSGDLEIYVMNSDGSDPVDITNAAGADQHPDWSPDGKRLVFIHQLHLMTMAADGSDVRDLDQVGSDPAWSPDGRTIAFAQGTNNLINFIPAEGGEVTGILTRDTGEGVQELTWSPDGTKLAFNHYMDSEGTEIYVVNRDGTDMTNISHEPVAADHPDWSPRG